MFSNWLSRQARLVEFSLLISNLPPRNISQSHRKINNMFFLIIIRYQFIYKFINRQMAHKLIVGNFFVGIFCTFWSAIGDFEIYLATLTQNDGESLKNGDVGVPAMETRLRSDSKWSREPKQLYWSNLCTFHSLQREFQNLCNSKQRKWRKF